MDNNNIPTSHHSVLLPGRERAGLDSEVEVTLETFDQISQRVRDGETHFEVEGVMASPELGIDGEIPCGARVRVLVLVEMDNHSLYEFHPIEVSA